MLSRLDLVKIRLEHATVQTSSSSVQAYQSVPSKRRKNAHAMRKHVQPCGDFQVAHLGMSERFDASLRTQNFFYLLRVQLILTSVSLLPLVQNKNGHFTATLASLILALVDRQDRLSTQWSLKCREQVWPAGRLRGTPQQHYWQNSAGQLDIDNLETGPAVEACHLFFFGQCCARCNNCGSHEVMLNSSSVDNTIAQIGQRVKKNNTKANKAPPNKQAQTNKTWPIHEGWNKWNVFALTTWRIAQYPGSHDFFSSKRYHTSIHSGQVAQHCQDVHKESHPSRHIPGNHSQYRGVQVSHALPVLMSMPSVRTPLILEEPGL